MLYHLCVRVVLWVNEWQPCQREIHLSFDRLFSYYRCFYYCCCCCFASQLQQPIMPRSSKLRLLCFVWSEWKCFWNRFWITLILPDTNLIHVDIVHRYLCYVCMYNNWLVHQQRLKQVSAFKKKLFKLNKRNQIFASVSCLKLKYI